MSAAWNEMSEHVKDMLGLKVHVTQQILFTATTTTTTSKWHSKVACSHAHNSPIREKDVHCTWARCGRTRESDAAISRSRVWKLSFLPCAFQQQLLLLLDDYWICGCWRFRGRVEIWNPIKPASWRNLKIQWDSRWLSLWSGGDTMVGWLGRKMERGIFDTCSLHSWGPWSWAHSQSKVRAMLLMPSPCRSHLLIKSKAAEQASNRLPRSLSCWL